MDSSCNKGPCLPAGEGKALKTLVDKLRPQSNRGSPMNFTCFSTIVNCSCRNNVCHVTNITISSSKLDGFIDGEALSKLQYLEILDLSDNQIHGVIPPTLNNLPKLQKIDLSDNQISGIIPPALNNLSSLESIFLSWNFLEGTIPRSLGQLSSLNTLDLSINLLTGEIPAELGNLSKLEDLELHENLLEGTLTPALAKLENLSILTVASNCLTGKLPNEYANLTRLLALQVLSPFNFLFNWVVIKLNDCLLTNININQCSAVGGNNFFGQIPKYITKWKQLQLLNLLGNEFENPPLGFFNMPELRYLAVSDVSITGSSFEMPEMTRLTNIEELDLSFNKLTGGIPKSMENLTLDYLILTSNMLSGNVNVSWIKKMELASSISRMSKAFCQDKPHKYDSLRINCGGSSTPVGGTEDEYEADDHKSNFFVSSDHRWAYVCTGDFYFAEANYKDYVLNASCGLSPSEETISQTARICPQSLKYYAFCLQKGNYSVKLHFFEIVFSNKSKVGKRIFDIYIQGKRERKDFSIKDLKASDKSSIDINTSVHEDSLLTIHFFWAGKGSTYLPNNLNGPLISAINVTLVNPVTKGRRGLSAGQIIGIVVGSVLAASLLLLAFMWRIGWIGDRELRVTSVKLRDKWYTLKQVKDATRNFSPRNQIGQGRFGIVYKAELPDQTVAVKKLSLQSNLDQVGTEVYALKNLKHDNLVELLDAYSKKDLNLLIYEYMERGSLEKALFVLLQACYLQAKGRLMDLVDKKLSTYNWQQAHDILHLAMMCVDQSPAVRPTMSEVVSVLEGEKNIQQISKADTSSA
ncbi:hypothetical protein Pint_09675 [Pistacia integerrima]|uniref:Uncharacterized protein n=1 Tax=Pistacia integerrima TaxID=434235 RepID=A0ACC0XFZ8_9ROSI|nr:hypothetical protein Pint_09675 [Pistacia integerrima]